MLSKLNIQRYSQLFKKRESDQIMAKEIPELRQYDSLLAYEVFWNSRKDYLQLANDFITSTIDPNQFRLNFFALRRYNMRLFNDVGRYLVEKQIFLQPTFKFKGFMTLIDDLFYTLDLYDEDVQGFELNNDIVSTQGLKYYVKGTFIPEIKNYIQKEESFLNQNDSKNQTRQLKSCSEILELIETTTSISYQDKLMENVINRSFEILKAVGLIFITFLVTPY